MSQKSHIIDDETSQEPVYAREDDVVPYEIPVSGATSISSPTMKFYKKGTTTDLSATYFAGSMSTNGTDTITTKTPQNLKAGDWVLSVFAVVDGYGQVVATYPFIVKRRGEL